MADYDSTEAILEAQSTEATDDIQATDEQQVTTEEQAPAQESDWDGSAWALKYRNKEIIPESRDKLMNWAMQGYNAEQKFSEINKLRQEVEAQQSEIAKYRELAQAFDSNPAFKQQIFDLYYQNAAQPAQPAGQAQEDIGIPPQWAEKVHTLESTIEEFRSQQADQELQRDINELQEKHPDYDWKTIDENGKTLMDDVLNIAMKMGGVSLDVAFKYATYDMAQERAAAKALEQQKLAREQQSRKGKSLGTPVAAPKAAPQGPNIGNMSYDEIAKQAIAESGVR